MKPTPYSLLPTPLTSGYSGKPLVTKIGLKERMRVCLLNAPEGFERQLEPIPADVEFVGCEASQVDCALLFVLEAMQLDREFPVAAGKLTMAGMLWVAWPKRSSGIKTDLTDNNVREIGLEKGLVDVKVCAIDEVWSGLKFVRRLRDRSG